MRPFFFGLALLASPAMAQSDIPSVVFDDARVSIEYGVYCEVPSIGSEEAPGTASGTVEILSAVPNFIWNTTQVPAYPGMSFGVKTLERTGTGLPIVTIQITHPPFHGSGVTLQTYETSISGGEEPSINAYTFDLPEELVTGTWVLQATDSEGLIYRVEFDVMDPELLPGIADQCLGDLFS